jgi:predicted nucleic acid-binding protein
LVVEVAASVARIFDDSERGAALAEAVWHLPHQFWIPLDEALAREAQHLASRDRLRGADAVYAAVAARFDATLVTRDRQQLERITAGLRVTTPEGALQSSF